MAGVPSSTASCDDQGACALLPPGTHDTIEEAKMAACLTAEHVPMPQDLEEHCAEDHSHE